jgi:hypothetical protein
MTGDAQAVIRAHAIRGLVVFMHAKAALADANPASDTTVFIANDAKSWPF